MENDCDKILFLVENNKKDFLLKAIKNGNLTIIKDFLENPKCNDIDINDLFNFTLNHIFSYNKINSTSIAIYLLDKFESKIIFDNLSILVYQRWLRFTCDCNLLNSKQSLFCTCKLLKRLCGYKKFIESITNLQTMVKLCYNIKIDVTIDHCNYEIAKLFKILRDPECEKFKELPIKTQLMYGKQSLTNLCALKLL
jgi:hypothetical protein